MSENAAREVPAHIRMGRTTPGEGPEFMTLVVHPNGKPEQRTRVTMTLAEFAAAITGRYESCLLESPNAAPPPAPRFTAAEREALRLAASALEDTKTGPYVAAIRLIDALLHRDRLAAAPAEQTTTNQEHADG